MTRGPRVRTAAIRLRGGAGPIWARVHWPPDGRVRPPLLVLFGAATDARRLALRDGVVVLAIAAVDDLADARAAVGWAADHAAELDADPARLLVAGTPRAAEVARLAADEGWPDLTLLEL
jgi:hypothetical protein